MQRSIYWRTADADEKRRDYTHAGAITPAITHTAAITHHSRAISAHVPACTLWDSSSFPGHTMHDVELAQWEICDREMDVMIFLAGTWDRRWLRAYVEICYRRPSRSGRTIGIQTFRSYLPCTPAHTALGWVYAPTSTFLYLVLLEIAAQRRARIHACVYSHITQCFLGPNGERYSTALHLDPPSHSA